VDFSEARELFVNIFRISDLTAKIVDSGLISENPRGPSAKSAKSGPRVDFTKVQGPLCKIYEIIRITNYFPTLNPMHRVHARWTGAGRAVHRGPTVARTEGTAGAQNGEGSEGNSARVSLELGWRCGGRAAAVQNGEVAALGERAAQARREGNRSGERCSDTR
jgi:hypothetical protein